MVDSGIVLGLSISLAVMMVLWIYATVRDLRLRKRHDKMQADEQRRQDQHADMLEKMAQKEDIIKHLREGITAYTYIDDAKAGWTEEHPTEQGAYLAASVVKQARGLGVMLDTYTLYLVFLSGKAPTLRMTAYKFETHNLGMQQRQPFEGDLKYWHPLTKARGLPS